MGLSRDHIFRSLETTSDPSVRYAFASANAKPDEMYEYSMYGNILSSVGEQLTSEQRNFLHQCMRVATDGASVSYTRGEGVRICGGTPAQKIEATQLALQLARNRGDSAEIANFERALKAMKERYS